MDQQWMVMSAPTPILNYSKPDDGGSRLMPARGRDVMLVLCIIASLGFGFASYVQLQRRYWTTPYAEYRVAQELQRRSEPGHVAPPFVGRKYVYESMWELRTTYFALAALCLVAGILVGSMARSQWSGRSG